MPARALPLLEMQGATLGEAEFRGLFSVQGLPGPNSISTLLEEGSCTLVGAVGFLILRR